MNRNKKPLIFLLIFLSSTIALLTTWGILGEKRNYFKVSLYELVIVFASFLTAGIGLYITVFLVEKNNDKRRLIDRVDRILSKIEDMIGSDIIRLEFDFNTNDNIKKMLSTTRAINNRISAILEIADKICIKTEIEFINEKFNNYKRIVDDVYNKKISSLWQTAVSRELDVIDSKICELKIKLYSL